MIIQTITEEEFKTRIKGTLIVQFSATWCGPCKALTKSLEAAQEELKNPICKMDIDTCPDLAAALRIRSVPTLIRFANGAEVKRIVGNKSIDEIKEFDG